TLGRLGGRIGCGRVGRNAGEREPQRREKQKGRASEARHAASDHRDRSWSTTGVWQDRAVHSPESVRAARRAIEALVEAGAIERDVGYFARELAELAPEHDPEVLRSAIDELGCTLGRGPIAVMTSSGPHGIRYHFCEREPD